MIILWWWIIMNKSLPHFLNGGKCITKRGLQPSDSLRARPGLSACVRVRVWEPVCVIWTVCTLATTYSLFTSVSQYKIVSVYVTSQPVYSVFAMLREHFPGDLAVYISHSNSFCAQYLPLPLSHFSFSPPLSVSLFSSKPELLTLFQERLLLDLITTGTECPNQKENSIGCLFNINFV